MRVIAIPEHPESAERNLTVYLRGAREAPEFILSFRLSETAVLLAALGGGLQVNYSRTPGGTG